MGSDSASYVKHYARLFVNRTDPYLAAARGRWYCHHGTLTPTQLEWALHGTVHLGLYAVSKTGTSKWLCLDADDPYTFEGLAYIAAEHAMVGNVLLERSRRGGHLWLVTPRVPWEEHTNYGHHLKLTYGLPKVEIYPPSGELKGVKAPGTKHPKTGLIYPFLDPATGEVVTNSQKLIESITPRPLPRVHDQRLHEDDRRHQVGGLDQLHHGDHPDRLPGNHHDLMTEIGAFTRMTYYGPEKAKGLCPLHDDHDPSLAVWGGYWKCFAGCGHGGLNAWRARVRERGVR